ncbi:MAG: NAD-dependent deacylase [Pseudomonadota bacterium]
MTNIQNIVVLTGAGISAESGVPTFRGPDGLWEGHRVEDVATPEAYRRDPDLVLDFYDQRRAKLDTVQPNPAHEALGRLDAEWPGELLIVTQNVDDLHERGGAKRLLHMHGELKSGWCLACNARCPWQGPMYASSAHPEPVEGSDAGKKEGFDRLSLSATEGPSVPCPKCGTSGHIRPDIVWFGEMPYEMERIEVALSTCDLFVSIGTSGAVYPAAGFVQTARQFGAETLEMNLDPSEGSFFFHESRMGKAGDLVPEWVEGLLKA